MPLAGSEPLGEALGATKNDIRGSIKLCNSREAVAARAMRATAIFIMVIAGSS